MALNKIFELLFRAQDWTNRRLLLIIDEAQGSYSYTPLWNDLIKGLSPDAGPLVALFSYGSPSSKPLEQFTPTPILFTHAQRVSIKPSPPENPDIGLFLSRSEFDDVVKRVSASHSEHGQSFRLSGEVTYYIWLHAELGADEKIVYVFPTRLHRR